MGFCWLACALFLSSRLVSPIPCCQLWAHICWQNTVFRHLLSNKSIPGPLSSSRFPRPSSTPSDFLFSLPGNWNLTGFQLDQNLATRGRADLLWPFLSTCWVTHVRKPMPVCLKNKVFLFYEDQTKKMFRKLASMVSVTSSDTSPKAKSSKLSSLCGPRCYWEQNNFWFLLGPKSFLEPN